MKINNTLSESAFLVNESRARRVELSQDIYAHLWTNEDTKILWNNFSKRVYPFDDIEIGIRNRFFLENLKSFIDKSSNPVFVNIGAGFTSYPFLIEQSCEFIEVDLKHVINYKSLRIDKWMKEGILPKRNIMFLPADICNRNDVKRLKKILSQLLQKYNSFILLEGITYYTESSSLEYLFRIFSELQNTGSILAFDYWQPSNINHPIFQRLRTFFSEYFNFKNTNYNFMDKKYLESIIGYRIHNIKKVQDLEKEYSDIFFLNNHESILPEEYVILKRC